MIKCNASLKSHQKIHGATVDDTYHYIPISYPLISPSISHDIQLNRRQLPVRTLQSLRPSRRGMQSRSSREACETEGGENIAPQPAIRLG